MIISVIGEGDARPEIAELAEQVGSELARRGVPAPNTSGQICLLLREKIIFQIPPTGIC